MYLFPGYAGKHEGLANLQKPPLVTDSHTSLVLHLTYLTVA